MKASEHKPNIVMVKASALKPSVYNPRRWNEQAVAGLTESIKRFGLVDPLLVNGAKERKNIIIGGHFRYKIARDLGYKEVPVVYLDIPDETTEKELNIRLNKNQGDWDYELLAEFDESLLADVGFSSEELDDIFEIDLEESETFDLEKELKKLDIKKITVQKGDVYQLGKSRFMCGDSTVEADFDKLMNGQLADMCLTDQPYRLSYMKGGIRQGKPVEGFGAKRNRKYLETDELPEDFVKLWMANVAKHAKTDFSIIAYEAWHNMREMWDCMAEHWTIRNMLIWHVPTRHQGFAAKYKFFSKYDIAMVGSSGTVKYNHQSEPEGLQEEYESALYATSGKPHWEGYKGGKKIQPTDFVSFPANDEKSSGQGVIFGTKPLEILIPYIKVLTKRGDLIVEPFAGSASTLIAATMLKRRCYIMEKSPTYMEIGLRRWEKLTGQKRVKL
ncbi:MAG: DNA modification methylase [Candidatus Nomurabacteria bacterium]|nr:MAG: DNA modification methylase [Candidatus Nomurabacteria bacterium]